ncbi:MAG: hypothetical protein ABIE03_02680 [Patescibacteria group bacterium]|nr:hypothetical protein [Patescibacteria group bacterium]
MIFFGGFSIFFIILFEVSLVEIALFSNICLLFIVVNLLFWFKKYKLAFVCGIVSALLIDLLLQIQLGRTMISLFIPLLILDFFDSLLRVEGKISRIIFSVLGVISSILISDMLFEFIFISGGLNIGNLISKILISTIITVSLGLILNQSWIPETEKDSGYILK